MTDIFFHPGVQTRTLSLCVQTRSSTVGLSAQMSSSKPSSDRNPCHKIYTFMLSKTQGSHSKQRGYTQVRDSLNYVLTSIVYLLWQEDQPSFYKMLYRYKNCLVPLKPYLGLYQRSDSFVLVLCRSFHMKWSEKCGKEMWNGEVFSLFRENKTWLNVCWQNK